MRLQGKAGLTSQPLPGLAGQTLPARQNLEPITPGVGGGKLQGKPHMVVSNEPCPLQHARHVQ